MTWPKVQISDIGKIGSGTTPKRGTSGYYGGEIPWVKSGELNSDIIMDTEEKITQLAMENHSALKIIPRGSLLVAMYGATVGQVAFLDIEATSNQAVCHIVPDENIIDPRYLFHVLNTLKQHWLSKRVGGGQPNISMKIVKETEISLPPLDEQKKIAVILDKAVEIEQTSATIQKIRNEVVRSVFLDMFGDPGSNPMGWEKVSLKELCSFNKTSVKPENIDPGTKYLGLECIEKETGKIVDVHIVESGELKSNKFWFNESYLLYGKLRPYLNKVALPCFEGVCSTDIIPIQPNISKTNREFISHILRSKSFVSFADQRSSGANLPRINPREVENYLTIKPPIELQNQFADVVIQVKNLSNIQYLAQRSKSSLAKELLT